MTIGPPLLTIAIPTFNRAEYLRRSLNQLQAELTEVQGDSVEILVIDNASSDATNTVLKQTSFANATFRTIRQPKNVGSDLNIAACFHQAAGRYVCVMGDDDLFVDGGLSRLLDLLQGSDFGVVYLRAFGYEKDFRAEKPEVPAKAPKIMDGNTFIQTVAHQMTFISNCVVNREVISDVEPAEFCGTNLVQVDMVILAALRSQCNLYISNYLVAALRNNSHGYDFFDIFVNKFFSIVESYREQGLRPDTIRTVESKMLLNFYPFYLFKRLLERSLDRSKVYSTFQQRFRNRLIFWLCIAPALKLPHPAGLVWIGLWTATGRILGGDFRRGLKFLKSRYCSKRH